VGDATVHLSLRVDAELTHSFDQVCQGLGLTSTAAFTILANKVARERRIPFAVAIGPFYSDTNRARLKKSIAQVEATGGTIHGVEEDDQELILWTCEPLALDCNILFDSSSCEGILPDQENRASIPSVRHIVY